MKFIYKFINSENLLIIFNIEIKVYIYINYLKILRKNFYF